jgi:hypothetical protein
MKFFQKKKDFINLILFCLYLWVLIFLKAMGYLATLFYICLITLWAMDTFIPNSSIIETRTTTRNTVFIASEATPSTVNRVNKVPEASARSEIQRGSERESPRLTQAREIVIEREYSEEI